MKKAISMFLAIVVLVCMAIPCLAKDEFENLEDARIGDYVLFGSYVQEDDEEAEPIIWEVISKKGDCLLLLSRDCLDSLPYQEEYGKTSWKDSYLREWLNEDFYDEAFTEDEQDLIMYKTVQNKKNPEYGNTNLKDTRDRVFILSISEALEYFEKKKERLSEPSEYALEEAVSYDADDRGYWLRTAGMDARFAAVVNPDGGINYGGYYASEYAYVRPAVWVEVED